MIQTAEIDHIFHFFESIGMEAECRPIHQSTFLPGILIEGGRLIVDLEQLKYPGDLLHEAGHIAIELPEKRPLMHDNIETGSPAESLELGAILWSYAALRHLNFPAAFVFHEEGYKGQSNWLIEQLEAGVYIGLPLLQWMGLACDAKNAAKLNVEPFPFMIKWLRE